MRTKAKNNQIIKDDEYYLNIGSDPPRFLYYRHVRAQEWEKLEHKPWDHAYDYRITQDELDFRLKEKLRLSPEQRYQDEKGNWLFHDCGYYMKGLDNTFDESSCNGLCCVPQCRYYAKYSRIEDDEVIEEHDKLVRALTEKNAIVQPPDMNSEEAISFFQAHPWALGT